MDSKVVTSVAVLGGSNNTIHSFVTQQTNTLGVFDSNVYYGWDFSNDDNKQYLSPIPASASVLVVMLFSHLRIC